MLCVCVKESYQCIIERAAQVKKENGSSSSSSIVQIKRMLQ